MYKFLYSLGLLSQLLQAATWLFLLGFGVWLYRRFRLRSLPWLGACALLAMSLDLIMPWVLVAVQRRGILRSSFEFHLMWTIGDVVLRRLTGLLLAVMVAAEVAGLLARLSPGPEQRALRLLLAVRERSVPLGLALLGLTLAEPLVLAILWLIEPAATVVRTAAG
jgi:hypothetical protein